MTVRGSCLCGAVRFQFESAPGPFEICHCTRCRKVTGGLGMPGLRVACNGYRFEAEPGSVGYIELPLRIAPPAYHLHFCRHCGSPLPDPEPRGEHLEVPAGLLDDDPGIRPDKHIYTEYLPTWDSLNDDLPTFTSETIKQHRQGVNHND